MSTPVVGTCTDCIVSLPPQPLTSLRFRVDVTTGYNKVLKHVTTANGYYPSDDLGTQTLTLAASSSYSHPTGISALFVSTDQPLQVTVTIGNVALTFNVNSLLILDDTYTSFTVANTSTTNVANVGLAYAEVST